jgi:beta-glucosidase
MGLFDDPFRYSDPDREKREQTRPEHRRFAREVAAKSIVLMKNEKQILPLSKDTKSVAFIGPMVKVTKDNRGFWSVDLPEVDYDAETVSQWNGVRDKLSPQSKLLYAEGCSIECKSDEKFAEAVAAAKSADVVIMSVGERWNESGEAKSRSNIGLPGMQEDLIKAVLATGKPVVVLINAGRPLVFNWTADNAPAILYTWWLGSEAGNAIADVIFGDYNPSGKLPITFPRSEGQIPIYYNHLNTGRPAQNDGDRSYRSAYLDLPISPKFEFGYGLSYTTFSYDALRLSDTKMRADGRIEVSFDVKNTGKYAGEEVVQLYLRDRVASVVRPVRELKDFKKIALAPGETKTVRFILDRQKLSFYDEKLRWIAEPGVFDLMIGSSSADIRLKETFELLK